VNRIIWMHVANHRNESTPGFTSTYGVKTLAWFGRRQTMEIAIGREKIKAWKRDWKIESIEKMNPNWIDLYDSIDVLATLVKKEAGPS
jgi:putative endonuclease